MSIFISNKMLKIFFFIIIVLFFSSQKLKLFHNDHFDSKSLHFNELTYVSMKMK